MKFVERYVKIAVIGALIMVGIALLMLFTVDWDRADDLKVVDNTVLVQDDLVPQSTSDAREATTLSLLPNRISESAAPTVSSRPDAREIAKTVGPFLRAWETFDPSRIVITADGSPYIRAVGPYVAREDLQDITDRTESLDPPGVCTGYGDGECMISSSWVGPDNIAGALTIRSIDDKSAFVTLYGVVRYGGERDRVQLQHLLDAPYMRSYGLYLVKDQGRWVVARAAAETLDRIG